MQADIRRAGNLSPPPPPPDQSDQRGRKRNLQLGKCGQAIFGTQMFWVPAPPPPPLSFHVSLGGTA